MLMRVGLLLGDEPELSRQLLRRLDDHVAAEAELVRVGPTGDNHIGRYDVIFDRISDVVPCYRSYLRTAALGGATIVNPPARLGCQDKLMALGVARQREIAVARAVLLPQRKYGTFVDDSRQLGSLQYPFRFDQAAAYVGFPAVLQALDGLPWNNVPVADWDELMRHFEMSAERSLMLRQQASAQSDSLERVKVLCLGAETIVLRLHDAAALHGEAWNVCDPAEYQDLAVAAGGLSAALGYPLNAVDFAVVAGEPLLLDGHQPQLPFDAVPFDDEAAQERLWDALAEALVRAPDFMAAKP